MRGFRSGIPLILALLLQACSAAAGPETVPPSSEGEVPPPMAAPVPAGGAGPPTLTVGAYLYAGGREGPDLGAYGYVVFTERPASRADSARYLRVCEAFQAGLIRPRDIPAGTAPHELAVTYWPTDTVPPAGAEAYECGTLVRRYDYGIANRLAIRVGKAGVQGPILVALPTPQIGPLPPGTDVLVVDASDVSDRFRRLFAVWRDHITDDPSEWLIDPGGFRAATAIVAFLEEFGPQVLSLIQLP